MVVVSMQQVVDNVENMIVVLAVVVASLVWMATLEQALYYCHTCYWVDRMA